MGAVGGVQYWTPSGAIGRPELPRVDTARISMTGCEVGRLGPPGRWRSGWGWGVLTGIRARRSKLSFHGSNRGPVSPEDSEILDLGRFHLGQPIEISNG